MNSEYGNYDSRMKKFLELRFEVVILHFILIEKLQADREKLQKLIQEDCRTQGRAIDFSNYESGESFLEHYQAGACDALFLDIRLNGISGITVAKKIRETDPRLPIIFTTKEPGFALEGFSVHAMEYLLKPLEAAKIFWCLEQLWENVPAPAFLTLAQIDGRGHSHPRTLSFDSILYGQYQNHAMEIHTKSDKFCSRLSFQSFTKLLPQNGSFFVCTRGLAVNLSHVEQVNATEILLSDGEKLPISRSRSQMARDAFSSWLFSHTGK